VQEVFGVGIVGVPVLENHVRLALPRSGARRGGLSQHDLGADADRVQIRLDRFGDSLVDGIHGDPELDVDAVGVAGGGEELPRLRRVIRVGGSRTVVSGKCGGNHTVRADTATAHQTFDDAVHVDRVVDRLADARVRQRSTGRVDTYVDQLERW